MCEKVWVITLKVDYVSIDFEASSEDELVNKLKVLTSGIPTKESSEMEIRVQIKTW